MKNSIKAPSLSFKSPKSSPMPMALPKDEAAIPAGFSLEQGDDAVPAGFQLDDDKYGSVGQLIATAIEGGVRGATLGLSDPFLIRTGNVKREDIKGRKEANPKTAIGSELLGTVAPALLGDEANLPGLVSKLGKGVERGAAEMLPSATSTLGKMATRGAATGAGLAAEGAVYGLGSSISEAALGDHDLVSEKTLANIGMSAALTGGFGALVGSALAPFAKDLSSGESKLAAQKISGADPLLSTSASADEKLSMMQALKKQKANAKEILEAGETIGAPVLPGQTSDSKFIQDATSAMSKAPTLPGVQTQQAIQKGFDAVDNVIKETLGASEHLAPYEAGALVKEQVRNTVDKIYEPIEAAYAEKAALGESILLPDKSRLKLYDKMTKMSQEFGAVGSAGGKIIENWAERALSQNTVKQLDDLIVELNSDLRKANNILNPDAHASQALGLAKEAIKDFRIGEIAKQGKNLEKLGIPEAEALAKEAIQQHKALDKQYSKLKDILSDLFSDQRLGRSKNVTHGMVESVLDGIANEKVIDKMFDPKNADGLMRLQKNFPDVFKTIIDQKKSHLLQSSIKDGKAEVGRVMREIYDEKKLSSKIREMMFSPADLKKLDASKTWIESLPKDINPSGTSKAEAFKEFFTNPLKATANNFIGYATKALIEKFSGNAAEAAKVMTLVNTEREAMKTAERINKGVKSILGQAKDTLPAKAFSKISTPDDYKEKTKEIKAVANNMQGFSDLVTQNTEGVYGHAPGIAGGLQMGMIRGVQFLNNKIPQTNVGLFEVERDPSSYEVSNFKRYYDMVEDPVSALTQVKDGTLTQETVETLGTVFPKLYDEMKQELLDQVTSMKKPQELPYETRQSISMFLNEALDPSFSSQNIMANQAAFAQVNAKAQADSAIKPTQGGMSKITLAKRSEMNRGNSEA